MVDKVERIRGTASATPTRVNESLSITSEPDNAWIAQRQSAINEDLSRRSLLTVLPDDEEPEGEGGDQPAADHERQGQREERRFSGESERIGTGNWDDDVPDGEHIGYL